MSITKRKTLKNKKISGKSISKLRKLTKLSKKSNRILSGKPNKKISSKYVKYHKTKNMLIMLENLNTLNKFSKSLSQLDRKVLLNYKQTFYLHINKYLYSKNKIDNLVIDQQFIYILKRDYNKSQSPLTDLININQINFGNINKYVELYMNNIINHITVIDNIFNKKDIPRLTGKELLYRGTWKNSLIDNKSKLNDEIIIENFCSTSTEQNIAENFINYTNKNNNNFCCLYILTGLKNVPYIYLPWNVNAKNYMKKKIYFTSFDEFEFLLPRRLKFKLVKKEKISSKNLFYNNKKLSFDNIAKYIKNNGISIDKLTPENIDKLFNKIDIPIITYHLEFISQEEIKPIQPYISDSNLNLELLIRQKKTNEQAEQSE
jgi:hypothetical protein